MAYKSLGTATRVSSILKTDSVLVEVDGSIRRITLDNLMDSINTGDEMLLRQVAWGVPIKQNQSSPEWGRIGNLTLWEEYKSHCGRYLVTNDGKAVKLNRTNSNNYAEGGTVDTSKGHIMWIAPRLYYRVIDDAVAGYPTLWMSQIPIGGFYIGTAGNGLYNCLGAYLGNVSNSVLVSRPNLRPSENLTITQFWEAAQKNGSDWGLRDYKHTQLLAMIYLSETGNSNSQLKLGYGLCGSTIEGNLSAPGQMTGATSSLGDNFGHVDITLSLGENHSRVNLFGVEDSYGWFYEMVQGIYGISGTKTVCIFNDVVNRLPTSSELSGGASESVRRIEGSAGDAFIRSMVLGEYFDLVPKEAYVSSSNSYWCDQTYCAAQEQLIFSGGNALLGPCSGIFPFNCNNPFSYKGYASTRLAYYGELEFVRPNQI